MDQIHQGWSQLTVTGELVIDPNVQFTKAFFPHLSTEIIDQIGNPPLFRTEQWLIVGMGIADENVRGVGHSQVFVRCKSGQVWQSAPRSAFLFISGSSAEL
jgi:hypothetical protein